MDIKRYLLRRTFDDIRICYRTGVVNYSEVEDLVTEYEAMVAQYDALDTRLVDLLRRAKQKVEECYTP